MDTETKKMDMAGIALSVLCAIHCLATPLLLSVLPLVGLDLLASHEFEWIMVAIVFCVAAVSFIRGYRHHKRASIFAFLAVGGLVFFAIRPLLDHDFHSLATVFGGSVFVLGHWKNWRWHRPACPAPCCAASESAIKETV